MKILTAVFTLVLITLLFSCKHVVTYDCTGTTPTYTQNVRPILDACCAGAGCHSANDREGDIDLSNYAGASAASSKKNFMGTIQHKPFYEKMPKDAEMLTNSQIHVLSCWIENGSPE